MRALGAITGLVAGLWATTGSFAADLGVQYDGGYGVPGGQIVIWDAEPGVVTRAYWLSPWRNRRYFPSSGEAPEIGRDEDLTKRDVPEPAPTYRRYWSTSSAFAPEDPRLRGSYYIEQEYPERSLK